MQFLKAGLLFLVIMRIAISTRRLSSGDFENFSWEGKPFAAHFWRAKRKIKGLTVRVPISDKLRFVLRRETGFDRIARSLGIASEWQTGDIGFDQKVFILSEDVSFNQALTRDRELRELSSTLLASPKSPRIECRAGMLYLGFATDELDDDDGTEKVSQRFAVQLGQLVKLRDGLQRIRAQSWDEQRDPSLTRKAMLVGTSLALGVAGVVALVFDLGVDRHQVVRENIPLVATWITVGIIGSLLLATFAWLKSTPHTHAVLLDILLAAAPGCWAAANGSATVYNEKFDRGVAQQLPVQVVKTERRKSRRRTSYYLYVERWPDSRGDTQVRIDEKDFGWIPQGSCITVTWHPGRLGDGWVSGYKPGCPDPAEAADVEK